MFLTCALLALGPAPQQQHYSIQSWTARDGLPQVTVNALEQTDDGFLWIGTFGGLCRFDGVDFVPFTMADHPELGSNRILALEATADGLLWVGMQDGGLAAYDGVEFRSVDALPAESTVTQILEDSIGNLWVCTLGAIWIIEADGARCLLDGLDHSAVLTETSPGRMLCGVQGFSYLDTEGRREPAYESVVNRVNEVAVAGGDLWYVDLSGLNRVAEDGTIKTIQEYDANSPSSLVADRKGTVWASNGAGLSYWDGSEMRDPFMGLGPPAYAFAMSQQLLEDTEGNLWLGGVTGLSRVRPSPVSAVRLPSERPLSASQVALLNGRPVTISYIGEYSYSERGTLERLGNAIRLLGPPAGERLWAVDRNRQLGRWDGGTFTPLELPALPSSATSWILASDGVHWLTGEFGLASLKGQDLRFWSEAEGLAPGRARSLLEGKNGDIWIGSASGLSRFDGDTFQRWTGGRDLPQGTVRALMEDDRGALWIGTYGGGLARFLDGVFDPVSFPDMHISSLSRESPGSDAVLILGNHALWRTGLSDLHKAADGILPVLRPERFDEGPGITALEAEGMRGPTEVIDPGGIHWFSTVDGLLRYDPQGHAPRTPSPPAYVTAVEVEEDLHRTDETLRFGPERRNPIFHFTAPAFSSPETVEFWYRLVGHDGDWRHSRGDRHATYSALRPGTYTFEVRARQGAAEFGPVDRSAALVVLPYWYETLAFRSALAILGLALVGAYVRSRVRTEAVRAERLEVEVAARTEDLLEVQANLEEKVKERTHQLEADMQRRESLTRELEQAKRFQTIGRLAGGVAHDFNNTLAVITCESHVLLSSMAKAQGIPQLSRDSVKRMQRATTHAAKLTRQLLAYSGRQMVKSRALDPNEVIGELEILLRRLIQASIEFRVELGDGVGKIYMDPGQFEQVVMNLVLNARDAIEAKGTIVLSTQRSTQESEGTVKQWVELKVEDDGQGIAQEDVVQIFEPFFTTRRSEGGTGLGLASVEGIIHQAQGSIDVRSAPGEGSRFLVRLPAHTGAEPRSLEQASAPIQGTSPARIVICEDQETLGKAVRLLLMDLGHKVSLYQDPRDALAAIETDPGVDLLLTDVVMPGMDGLELYRKAHARRPNLRVLFVTGYALNPEVWRELSASDLALLEKPFHPDQLAREVQRVMHRDVSPI